MTSSTETAQVDRRSITSKLKRVVATSMAGTVLEW
jgi:hypothetical protein